MVVCDLCEQPNQCSARHIEGKEYDICADCWKSLADKLQGKGRRIKGREFVLLPNPSPQAEPPASSPTPGYPPEIIGHTKTALV